LYNNDSLKNVPAPIISNPHFKLLLMPKEIKKDTLSNEIEKFHCFLKDDHRNGKPRLKEKDYDKLIDWINFYYSNDFKLPQINQKIEYNCNKVDLLFTFKEFYKRLYKNRNLDTSTIELLNKCFGFAYTLESMQKQPLPNGYKQTNPNYIKE